MLSSQTNFVGTDIHRRAALKLGVVAVAGLATSCAVAPAGVATVAELSAIGALTWLGMGAIGDVRAWLIEHGLDDLLDGYETEQVAVKAFRSVDVVAAEMSESNPTGDVNDKLITVVASYVGGTVGVWKPRAVQAIARAAQELEATLGKREAIAAVLPIDGGVDGEEGGNPHTTFVSQAGYTVKVQYDLARGEVITIGGPLNFESAYPVSQENVRFLA